MSAHWDQTRARWATQQKNKSHQAPRWPASISSQQTHNVALSMVQRPADNQPVQLAHWPVLEWWGRDVCVKVWHLPATEGTLLRRQWRRSSPLSERGIRRTCAHLVFISSPTSHSTHQATVAPLCLTIPSHRPSWAVWLLSTSRRWGPSCSQIPDSTTGAAERILSGPPPRTPHRRSRAPLDQLWRAIGRFWILLQCTKATFQEWKSSHWVKRKWDMIYGVKECRDLDSQATCFDICVNCLCCSVISQSPDRISLHWGLKARSRCWSWGWEGDFCGWSHATSH